MLNYEEEKEEKQVGELWKAGVVGRRGFRCSEETERATSDPENLVEPSPTDLHSYLPSSFFFNNGNIAFSGQFNWGADKFCPKRQLLENCFSTQERVMGDCFRKMRD